MMLKQISKEQVLAKIKSDENGCWNWIGYIKPHGYGTYTMRVNKKSTCFYAHRLSYEAFVGEIPAKLTLDHLCRNRKCVNPDHLEPVSRGENVRRGTGMGGRNYVRKNGKDILERPS